MNPLDWARIKFFQPTEFSDPITMERDFMLRLDAFRCELAVPVTINFSNGPEKHAADSLHPHGKACDIMLSRNVTVDDFLCATRYFSEVGIYPEWTNNRLPDVKGGLHVGFNWTSDRTVRQRKYWIGVKNKTGGNDYVELSIAKLRDTRLL